MSAINEVLERLRRQLSGLPMTVREDVKALMVEAYSLQVRVTELEATTESPSLMMMDQRAARSAQWLRSQVLRNRDQSNPLLMSATGRELHEAAECMAALSDGSYRLRRDNHELRGRVAELEAGQPVIDMLKQAADVIRELQQCIAVGRPAGKLSAHAADVLALIEGSKADTEIPVSGTAADVPAALRAAVAAIYFTDSSDYECALWSVARALDPSIADLLERDSQAAFDVTHPDEAAEAGEVQS